ncbi:MAG: hypothetical protein JXR70_19285 [Spirochaetales bacterium]|nr:hypothetical protein [Spirochaetales bacterium]
MKQAGFVLIFVAILLIFTGCPEFFSFNIYDGLDPVFPPDKAELEKMDTSDALDYLEDEIASDSFIEALVQDEANTPEGEDSKLDDIDNYLAEIYTNPAATTEDKSTAAVLAGDLRLGTSGAIDVVNNFIDAASELSALSSNPNPTEDDVKTILTAIVPETIVNDEQAFKDMLNGFFAAADAYEVLGDTILAGGADDGGAVTGGVVMNAAVTLVIDELASGIVKDTVDRADALWNLLKGDPSGVDASFPMSDPFADTTIQTIATAGDFNLSAVFNG